MFDQKIADSLRKNGSTLNISLDCGTRETFEVVKRRDMFEKVIDNLKRYKDYGKIEIKYNILPGVNDDEKDFIGIVNILKSLDISELVISFDYEMPLRTSFYPISALIRKLKENGLKFKFHVYYSATQLENSISKYITPQSQVEYERKNNYLRDTFYKEYKDDYQAYREFVRNLELEELSNCLNSGVTLNGKDIKKYFFSFEPAEIYAKRETAMRSLARQTQI
jgi:molybdenum cofactor biosynthesis enzyme MoaA